MLLSIRRRVLVLLLILLLMPVLFYRLALEFNRQLLEQQIIQQSQTVQNLALILANRPDLWSRQIFAGSHAHQPLQHLDLTRSALWIVNDRGQTTYVIGHLPMGSDMVRYDSLFAEIGRTTIRLIHSLFPSSLPYLIPIDPQPERSLLRQALSGGTAQRFRFDASGQPLSLMSATPLVVNGRQIGAIVLEQRVETLFGPRLRNFYRIIGIATVVMLTLMIIIALYALSLSGRITRLEKDVLQAFDRRRSQLADFQDTRKTRWLWDEADQLRHQIYVLLSELRNYERFLRNLPRTLRHEIHNPLNRLHLSLQRVAQTGRLDPYLQQAQHGVAQLQHILDALSEAGSIEQALTRAERESYDAIPMLRAYGEALREQHGDRLKLQIEAKEALITGDGFLLEQALDKLIDNAFDFSEDGTVTLRARKEQQALVIEVVNKGRLPDALAPEQLFSGMTSVRPASKGGDAPHLGLGLYVARLIAEFHHGQIRALQQGDEVVFQLRLPLAQSD